MIEILLGIGFIGSLAAFFVAWAKYDEQKKLTKEEYEKRWDEISRAVGLENELEQSKTRDCQGHIDFLNFCVDTLEKKNAELQDRLSALLCPHNDHVWEVSDAYRGECRCKKCGRVKDATD